MEKRFSMFSIAALAFALALVVVIPTGAMAAADMGQKDTPHDKGGAAMTGRSAGMDEHAGKTDGERYSWSGNKGHIEGLTSEQQKEYNSWPKDRKEMVSKLSEHQRHDLFSMKRQERNEFFSLRPRERQIFFTLKPAERTAFLALPLREKDRFVTLQPGEREVFLSLTPRQRQTYVMLKPEEKRIIMSLKPQERGWIFSQQAQERTRFFSARPDERQRMLSRSMASGNTTGGGAEGGKMGARDTDMSSKDTDRSRGMKSDEDATGRDRHKGEMSAGEHDKSASYRDMPGETGSDMDMDMSEQDTM